MAQSSAQSWHSLVALFGNGADRIGSGWWVGVPRRSTSLRRPKRAGVKVELKIWRYDASTGDRALKPYEVDVSDEATLLDTLDVVKDKVDGTLAYRKSCRMMICGSCGMRVDGGAVLACKTRIADVVADGHVPVVSAMGNLPIVKDLVVDMDPFWQKMQAVKPYLEPRLDRATEKENIVTQERMDVIHKESLCINCGCCVSECNSMESDPDFLGPAALAKGSASSATRATGPRWSASSATARSTGSGTAPVATSATSAARRASIRATRSRSSAPRR